MSSLDLNLFNYSDLYPNGATLDDRGIPSDYDLRLRLPESFQGIEFWADLFAAYSRVLWEHFEKHRRAMMEARDAYSITRPFLPMQLRMQGLDYRSDSLTDEDYKRVTYFYSLYAKTTKHRDSFAKFMGFMKGMRVELVRLWSSDYKTFHNGKGKTVFQGGEWFPTTHVGLAVEVPEGIERPTDEQLIDLFYTLAPINLVLKWISDLTTVKLPDLGMDLVMTMEEERAYAIIGIVYRFYLRMFGFIVDEETNRIYLEFVPDVPEDGGFGFYEAHSTDEYGIISADILNFVSSPSSSTPLGWTFTRDSRASYIDNNRFIRWVSPNIPRLHHYDPDGSFQGWLMEPERYGYIRVPTDPTEEPWEVHGITVDSSSVAINPENRLIPPFVPDTTVEPDPSLSNFSQTINFSDPDFTDWTFTLIASSTDIISAEIRWYDAEDNEISPALEILLDTNSGSLAVTGGTGVTTNEQLPNDFRWITAGVTRPSNATKCVYKIFPFQNAIANAVIYYSQLENGTVGTTPFIGSGCEICYRAPEQMVLPLNIATLMVQPEGFFALRARTLGDVDDMGVLTLGNTTSVPVKQVRVYAGTSSSRAHLQSTQPVNSVGANIGVTEIIDDRTFDAPRTMKLGWLWNRITSSISIVHNGNVRNEIFLNPSITTAGYIGQVIGSPSFHGYIDRFSLVPIPIDPQDLDNLLG